MHYYKLTLQNLDSRLMAQSDSMFAVGILTLPAARRWALLHPQRGVPRSWCRSPPAQWYLAEISITQQSVISPITQGPVARSSLRWAGACGALLLEHVSDRVYVVAYKSISQCAPIGRYTMNLPWTRNSPSLSLGLWGYAHERASAFVMGGSKPPRLRVRGCVRPPVAWRQPQPPPRFLRGGGSLRPDSLGPPRRSAAALCDKRCSRCSPITRGEC